MPLAADLTTHLDASTLVQTFLSGIGSQSGSLNAIADPTDPSRVQAAAGAGGAFDTTSILDAVGRLAGVSLPTLAAPPTLQRLEAALTTIEQFTTRDQAADLANLAQQLTTTLEQANQQGIPGAIASAADVLSASPTATELQSLLSLFLSGGGGPKLPAAISEYLPALLATIRVLAGLMVYETVLGEGERLTGVMTNLFKADRAQAAVDRLQAATQFGDGTLAQALDAADPNDVPTLESLASGVDAAAASLDDMDAYVSEGMGFGEATLVHFDVADAQGQIAAAGALLRDPNLGPLRKVLESLAQTLEPTLNSLDPAGAASRSIDAVLQLAETQVDQAATAITNLNADVVVSPLTSGITALTAPLQEFTNVVARIVTEVRAALEQVRAALAALPIDDILTAIRTALQPVTQALQQLQQLVADIQAALQAAANAVLQTLGQVEQGVDQFQQQVTALFTQARQFIDGLHLDQIVSQISDKIKQFVAVLQQAQMKPYFDTASSAIGSAADAISKVPLGLLPDSMKADLDQALAPVREVQPDDVAAEIESLLQIGPDGKFELRSDLEQALAQIQAKYDAVIAVLQDHDPSKYVDQIDAQLSALASRIQALTPQLTLKPIQDAIAQLKSALGGFDLAAALQPVQSVFDNAIKMLDQYSPAQLLQPLEQRVSEARQKLEAAIRFNDWRPALDDLATRLASVLDKLDPAAIETLLRQLLERLVLELNSLPDVSVGNWLGMIVSGLMRGSDLRIGASSIGSVLRWVQGGASASVELSTRAGRIADALTATRTEVSAFDPTGLSGLVTQLDTLRASVSGLAAKLDAGSALAIRLSTAATRLDASGVLGRQSSNRARYLDLIATAAGLGAALRNTGMSEADVAVQQLQQAVAPLQQVGKKVRLLAGFLGIGPQSGLSAILRSIFSVATPARLTALVTKLVTALRQRFRALIDQILAPVRAAIDTLKKLLDLLDLQPVIDGVQSVFQTVRNQVLSFSPTSILGDQLTAFNNLKQQLQAFDPLAPIIAILNGVRDTAARVVGKLSARKLLAAPIAIYETIVNALKGLNIQTLLQPVLDALDTIAQQVDQGLHETVDAFKRLQQSLPPPGDGSSGSASVSVGIG